MGQITSLGKWNLEHGCWQKNPKLEDIGRSFAIADYEPIINDDGKINYIIIAPGIRVEDCSKDFLSIKEKFGGIAKALNYYGQKNGNYIIKLFLMDADAPIVEDAKMLAGYIDHLATLTNTASINLLGLSKCSVMGFYVPRFFKQIDSFAKTNIYNTAAPYDGTKLASPLVFYPEVKRYLEEKLPQSLAQLVFKNLVKFYEGISSNSHMDFDIAIPGGIPADKITLYDEGFIKNVFSDANVNAIKRINRFMNFTTGIDDKTLKEAIKSMNFTGIGLCMLDAMFFEHKSDGMVYTLSQRIVEDVLDIKSHHLDSTHHEINSIPRAFNDILGIVNDTIEEKEELKRNRTKKF